MYHAFTRSCCWVCFHQSWRGQCLGFQVGWGDTQDKRSKISSWLLESYKFIKAWGIWGELIKVSIINWKQNSYPKTLQTEIVASQLAKKLLKLFTSKPISRCIGRFWSKHCVDMCRPQYAAPLSDLFSPSQTDSWVFWYFLTLQVYDIFPLHKSRAESLEVLLGFGGQFMHLCTLYTSYVCHAWDGRDRTNRIRNVSSVALRPPPYAFLNLFDAQALRYRWLLPQKCGLYKVWTVWTNTAEDVLN